MADYDGGSDVLMEVVDGYRSSGWMSSQLLDLNVILVKHFVQVHFKLWYIQLDVDEYYLSHQIRYSFYRYTNHVSSSH